MYSLVNVLSANDSDSTGRATETFNEDARRIIEE
jgi:hypothetical protein